MSGSENSFRKTKEHSKSLQDTWVSFSPENDNVEIGTDDFEGTSEPDNIHISMAPYIQAYLAHNGSRVHCCGLHCLPAPFERASSSSWLNPKFDSEVLEKQYRKSALPQVKLRFRYALLYIITVMVAWSLYFGFVAGFLSSTSLFLTAIFIGFAFVTSLAVILTKAKYYHRFRSQLYRATSVLMLLLTGLSLFMTSQTMTSPTGQFCMCLEILMIIYTVVPFPLYLCFGFGSLYSAVFEFLHYSDGRGLPVRILAHTCIHLIGIHILIMTNVRMRGTFMKVGQSLLVRKQLEMEKQLKEKMIHSVMPPKVAEWLMTNEGGGVAAGGKDEDARCALNPSHDIRSIFRPFIMNQMENVSILFADIVGFTQMSSTKSAEQVVSILNNLFERFDEICKVSGCEKISTLGDCYYCVSGCPEPRPDHASCCITMGLGMIESINEFVEKSGEKVNMRVGVHTGSVLCGIVGTNRFKFDVWSNDVTFANKMETTGTPGRVHLSQRTKDFLDDEYTFQHGSVIDGVQTYFILGRREFMHKDSLQIDSESPVASSLQQCNDLSCSSCQHTLLDQNLLSVSCDDRLHETKNVVPLQAYFLSKHLSVSSLEARSQGKQPLSVKRFVSSGTLPSTKQPEKTWSQNVPFLSKNSSSSDAALSPTNTHIPAEKVHASATQCTKSVSFPGNLNSKAKARRNSGCGDRVFSRSNQTYFPFAAGSNRWQYSKLKPASPDDKVEEGMQMSLTDSNDEKNENISELVTRKEFMGDSSRVETSPRLDDHLSTCQSSNSRKDSGIRSTSRRSSILHHVFTTPSSECQRVSGYYTSSQSSINLGLDRRGKLPAPQAVSEHFGVCFQHIRKQSDLQLIRCVQANSASRGSYFVKPPLSPFSLFFTEKSMESEYRKKSHRELIENLPQFDSELVTEPPTLATPRFNTYLDIIISLLVFMAVSFSLFLLWNGTAVWFAVFAFASISQLITVVVCLRSIILASTDWFLDWYLWHVCGAILVSLPVISVLVNFPSEFSTYSIQHYCYLFFISLVHFCNFTQLNCWMKSVMATVAAVCFLILLEMQNPSAINSNVNNSTLFNHGKSNPFSNLSESVEVTPPNIIARQSTQSDPFLGNSINHSVALVEKAFRTPKKFRPESLSRPKRSNGFQTSGASRTLSDENLDRHRHSSVANDKAFYSAEIYLDIALLLLLIWFLNREFEISYRLSFYGNIVAAKDKAHVQSMRDQADWLLHNIIPRHVADHLKHTARYSENVHNAGIIFASLVNFSDMYDEAYLGGRECLRVLNELISDFDELLTSEKYPTVEKIKTIGSTFMAASGLNSQVRKSDTNDHLFELMDFAIALQQVVESFNRDLLEFNLILRIGYNYGDVTAGVIGTTKLHYDIWGDPVNIASRMDSTGIPGRIQVPSTCLHILSPRYEFEPRGQVFVKGKNNMNVYLLADSKSG